MNTEDLREELKTLHHRLESTLHTTPQGRDSLSLLMTDLVRLYEGEELDPDEGESLKEQLEDQAADFEARHPRLAAVLRDVMDVLAKLGI
jgi:hypothetical protein